MKNEKQSLNIVKLRIDSLTKDPENAKLHPDFQVQQIKKSIADFGMNDPIGVWGENNLIVEGHGRAMACEQLGETEIDCIRLDHLSEEERSDLHPTMKPIKLIARLVANSTKRDEIVLDLFGGSGSTLMACEQLGRVCRTVELDEKYATAIVNRWEEYTHQKARRL